MESENEMSSIGELDDEALQELYSWIDEIPLSRPKRNIARDFSDGVLVAEIANHFMPKMVEMHNYSAANSVNQKKDNWATLQRKVFGRLEYRVADEMVDGICKCRAGAIELFLINLRNKIDKFLAKRRAAALRKQNQVYDEFSPGALSENVGYQQEDGYTNGTSAAYGYPYNVIPQQELIRNMIAGGMPAQNEYYQGSYNYDQQQSMQSYLVQQNVQGPPKKSQHVMTKRESSNDVTKHGDHKQQQHAGARHPKGSVPHDAPQNIKLLLEEKEQALLASQETVQILQVKIRRLEHLLNLKDIRIEDLTRRIQQATQHPPRHLPPQAHPPFPPMLGAAGQPLPRMHTTPPLPPVRSPPKSNT